MAMDKLKTRIAGARLKVGAWGMKTSASLKEVYDENSGGMAVGSMIGVLALQMSTMAVMAEDGAEASEDIFDRASGLMTNIYGKIAGISTITAATVATICIFMMIFSKNPQAVQSSIQWLKRIVICWAAIMLMAFIVRFLTDGLGLSADQAIEDFGTL